MAEAHLYRAGTAKPTCTERAWPKPFVIVHLLHGCSGCCVKGRLQPILLRPRVRRLHVRIATSAPIYLPIRQCRCARLSHLAFRSRCAALRTNPSAESASA